MLDGRSVRTPLVFLGGVTVLVVGELFEQRPNIDYSCSRQVAELPFQLFTFPRGFLRGQLFTDLAGLVLPIVNIDLGFVGSHVEAEVEDQSQDIHQAFPLRGQSLGILGEVGLSKGIELVCMGIPILEVHARRRHDAVVGEKGLEILIGLHPSVKTDGEPKERVIELAEGAFVGLSPQDDVDAVVELGRCPPSLRLPLVDLGEGDVNPRQVVELRSFSTPYLPGAIGQRNVESWSRRLDQIGSDSSEFGAPKQLLDVRAHHEGILPEAPIQVHQVRGDPGHLVEGVQELRDVPVDEVRVRQGVKLPLHERMKLGSSRRLQHEIVVQWGRAYHQRFRFSEAPAGSNSFTTSTKR